ncbi:MAG: hypothetical protein D3904_00395 [Candidatus Electrothrix sp. EH2]|nr:hypothetical protein [Candidatus Electrothrix sp. EH2]
MTISIFLFKIKIEIVIFILRRKFLIRNDQMRIPPKVCRSAPGNFFYREPVLSRMFFIVLHIRLYILLMSISFQNSRNCSLLSVIKDITFRITENKSLLPNDNSDTQRGTR